MDIYFCIILAENEKQVFAKMQKCKIRVSEVCHSSIFRGKKFFFDV